MIEIVDYNSYCGSAEAFLTAYGISPADLTRWERRRVIAGLAAWIRSKPNDVRFSFRLRDVWVFGRGWAAAFQLLSAIRADTNTNKEE